MSYGDIVIAHNELRDVLDVEGPAMTEGARLNRSRQLARC